MSVGYTIWQAYRAGDTAGLLALARSPLGERDRHRLLHYLGRLHDPEALPLFEEALTSDASARNRVAALRAVRESNAGTAGRVIARAAADPAQAVRARAVEALGALGLTEHAPLVRSLLEDPDPTVRTFAATAVADLGDSESVPVLLELALNGSKMEAHAAIRALDSVGTPEAHGALREVVTRRSGIRRWRARGVLRSIEKGRV